jgi:hypothetical protein
VLQVFDSTGTRIDLNDNWKDSQQAAIQASGLAPTDDNESAIIRTLPAGAYTAQLSGANGGQGIALTAVYELSAIADPAAPPDRTKDLQRTQNLAARVVVRGGDQLAILGLIVSGRQPNSMTPAPARRLIFRARGPSTGVTGALEDPQLELYDNAGNLLAQNNDWQFSDSNATVQYPKIYRDKVTASGFAPGPSSSQPCRPEHTLFSAAEGAPGKALLSSKHSNTNTKSEVPALGCVAHGRPFHT